MVLMSFFRIGTAARLSGLRVSTIRNWELRYGLVVPRRTPGGQRLYSGEDVERLTALKALVDQGLTAGEAHNVVRTRPLSQPAALESNRIRADSKRVRREVAAEHARAAAEFELEYERLRELRRHAAGERARYLERQAEAARAAAERRRRLVHPV